MTPERASTETPPPTYSGEKPPAYAPKANPRFAKHDDALGVLYQRCAEEQAAIAAAEQALAEPQTIDYNHTFEPSTPAPKPLNPLERWNRWSARFYAPNLYKDKKK
jgi:hypothetical protein